MRPSPGRLAPSSTPTKVPIRASWDSKKSASLSSTVWGQTRTGGRNTGPDPNHVPFPEQDVYHVSTPFYVLCGTMCPRAPIHPSYQASGYSPKVRTDLYFGGGIGYQLPRIATAPQRVRTYSKTRIRGPGLNGTKAVACNAYTKLPTSYQDFSTPGLPNTLAEWSE